MNGLRIFLGLFALGIVGFSIQHWLHSRPDPVVSAAIESAEVWLSTLDNQGYRAACSERFVGENWTPEECLSDVEPYYSVGAAASRQLESRMHLSKLLPEHRQGERVLLVYRTRFAAGEGEEHVIMALQSAWKVDGYFVRQEN